MARLRALPREEDVFINVPFDSKYRDLYIARVSGLAGLGFRPRSVLEIPPHVHRLARLRRIIGECASSVHDLSRVELSIPDRLPRFNMAFELGLVLGDANTRLPESTPFFMFESESYRLQTTLSDMNGYDPLIHSGKPRKLLAKLRDAYGVKGRQPSLEKLWELMQLVARAADVLEKEQGSLFTRAAFEEWS